MDLKYIFSSDALIDTAFHSSHKAFTLNEANSTVNKLEDKSDTIYLQKAFISLIHNDDFHYTSASTSYSVLSSVIIVPL